MLWIRLSDTRLPRPYYIIQPPKSWTTDVIIFISPSLLTSTRYPVFISNVHSNYPQWPSKLWKTSNSNSISNGCKGTKWACVWLLVWYLFALDYFTTLNHNAAYVPVYFTGTDTALLRVLIQHKMSEAFQKLIRKYTTN